ncbi:hypothetical protein G6F43_008596 [Rhizopus delemar]|nr:hypothetical protein G6F43_008596 [Rhizopus delemar]
MSTPNHIAEKILNLKNEEDIATISRDQDECLDAYRDSEKRLEAFNKFSKARYQDIYQHFEQHTKLLKQMKKDMNSVFTKLRKIKSQLNEAYPEQHKAAVDKHPPPVIEND